MSWRSNTHPQVVAVLGAGSWGTTFAKIVADAGASRATDVRVWARRPEIAVDINDRHRNSQYLKDTVLPANLTASADPAEVLAGAELVVLAVPAQTLRAQLRSIRHLIPAGAVVVSLMKGLEVGTDSRMSQVIEEELHWPEERVAVISGPNLAMEIADRQPTASVVACSDLETAAWIARACTAPYFRPYTNTDVVGVEIGGIVKNVIALAVGICEGKGMGDNTKASVMTRGLAETTRLALALGGDAETMSGLAGMGDLIATCSSPLSRNHTAGRLLAQGLTLDEVNASMKQTAEGIKSAQAVLDRATQLGVYMPITENVVAVLQGAISVDELGPRLLSRELKSESVHAQ
ncbi:MULTISPECIES: NAD(P)H-dependent glycerol-3-phosphate dehydrogenase [Arthrobacter]|uniref:Glycerol-3-phosphate dehydrogenase [NAD(P)+] n=1 Tax=Arthrobacter sunyaminii TaxID=2816859 RepID=A0A975PDB7_9MICC|nr:MULTISPECIES: NAD(P)H-dependent glycerol-3-phosphate dehydrogenase [Arthrobacter]MBO0896038.1 NAD(P)-dependent glycerol-3-phosphate dehydrogenase [Arthrobacter sunyaminii]MBO0907713.1 NAD(P)-dependent glycerol-3-phosphate dehydrogenase [Arthrobacter sunyaminii]QWQ35268.1 NAD(P)-dependent glycerol-3-phosphate dehydrogenase [Arthrobacter sunyaminii]